MFLSLKDEAPVATLGMWSVASAPKSNIVVSEGLGRALVSLSDAKSIVVLAAEVG